MLSRTIILLILAALTTTSIPSLARNRPPQKEIQIVIESSYKWSKKIWGIYRKTKETTSTLNHNRLVNKQVGPIHGNILFKKGQLFILNPIDDKEKISYKVESLPYQVTNVKGHFKINLDESEDKLYNLYAGQIKRYFNTHPKYKKSIGPIDIDQLAFKDMRCRKSRYIIKCSLKIGVRIN